MFAVFEPATIAASMAINRPEAIGAAPALGAPVALARWGGDCRPKQSGGRRSSEFLVSRGMTPQASGEESRCAAVAARRSRRSRPSARSGHKRGRMDSVRLNRVFSRRTRRTFQHRQGSPTVQAGGYPVFKPAAHYRNPSRHGNDAATAAVDRRATGVATPSLPGRKLIPSRSAARPATPD